jgi:uncharacterized protein YceK
MIEMLRKLTISLCALSMLSGCATVQSAGPGGEGPVDIEAHDTSRKKNILWTIGGILLLGAIIVSEAEDGAQDAVRDAVRP